MAAVRTPNGLFLPGGGLDSGEIPLEGLRREVFEELGAKITAPHFLGQCGQYLYSRHYSRHFQKQGFFYACELDISGGLKLETDHEFLWLKIEQVREALSEEYQRWIVNSLMEKRAK